MYSRISLLCNGIKRQTCFSPAVESEGALLLHHRRFRPLTDEERSSESRRDTTLQRGIPPELSNLMNQVLATERLGPLRRGDFVLRTPNLRSWIAADATHLHHTIFINTANSVCRGAGDSHLPRSMRARSPHVLSPRRRFHR